MRYLGGHLGTTVSALLDGQLDAPSAERAWTHVHSCEACQRQVTREGWVKTRLAAMPSDDGPPAQLLGSLYGLGAPDGRPSGRPGGAPGATGRDPHAEAAWVAVAELERRGRGRRRAGLAVAGAGSVSVAVFGLASLTGATLGIGAVPTDGPSMAQTRTPTTTPSAATPQPRLKGATPTRPRTHELRDGVRRAPQGGEGSGGLQP